MRKKIDRLYHYPKGYIDKRTKKPKTGFMSPHLGARLYVEKNLNKIKKFKQTGGYFLMIEK